MTPMPPGAYVSIIGNIRPGAGGQTRVLLMRHRLFGQQLGIDVPILTYNPAPDYDDVRASLHADRLLLPDSRLLNMHEDLRARELAGPAVGAVPRPPATPDQVRRDRGGRPWQRRMVPADGGPPWLEFLRPDGSAYARTPVRGVKGPAEVCGSGGDVIGAWPTVGGLWRWWTQLVAPPAGHVFVLSDSRYVSREIALIEDERFFVLHQMHNPHTVGKRRWTSRINASYADAMEHLGNLDALSCLTVRQRDDVALRFGPTDNLAVVPNPVEPPVVPDPLPERRPGRIVMIARLHRQKRLDRAVDALGMLVATHPDARLDIYGSGPEREALERQVADAGLTGRVTLHGHQPGAADEFWSADLCWLTSAFEGDPLVLLEARSCGCPAVAFDVPYGPREQIIDRVDGRLVPAGDVPALVRATTELLDDRVALDAMRGAAQEGAAHHGPQRFLDDWAAVVAGAIDRKPHRVRLEADVRDARLDRPSRAEPGRLELTAELEVRGPRDPADLAIHWQAYGPDSPAPVELPLTVEAAGHTYRLAGTAPLEVVGELGQLRGAVTVRLLLACRNRAWRRDLFVGSLTADTTRSRTLRRHVADAIRRRTGS